MLREWPIHNDPAERETETSLQVSVVIFRYSLILLTFFHCQLESCSETILEASALLLWNQYHFTLGENIFFVAQIANPGT